jgi:hypothetical protein
VERSPNRVRGGTHFLHSEFNEFQGQLSPDSHWMAYTSNKTGHREVHVLSFPTGEGETRISIAGGEPLRWRGDSKELFFMGADAKMMTVAVKAELPSGLGKKASFVPGVPQPLFEAHFARNRQDDGVRIRRDPRTGSVSCSTPTRCQRGP